MQNQKRIREKFKEIKSKLIFHPVRRVNLCANEKREHFYNKTANNVVRRPESCALLHSVFSLVRAIKQTLFGNRLCNRWSLVTGKWKRARGRRTKKYDGIFAYESFSLLFLQRSIYILFIYFFAPLRLVAFATSVRVHWCSSALIASVCVLCVCVRPAEQW